MCCNVFFCRTRKRIIEEEEEIEVDDNMDEKTSENKNEWHAGDGSSSITGRNSVHVSSEDDSVDHQDQDAF
jgi:hypothetical protein